MTTLLAYVDNLGPNAALVLIVIAHSKFGVLLAKRRRPDENIIITVQNVKKVVKYLKVEIDQKMSFTYNYLLQKRRA